MQPSPRSAPVAPDPHLDDERSPSSSVDAVHALLAPGADARQRATDVVAAVAEALGWRPAAVVATVAACLVAVVVGAASLAGMVTLPGGPDASSDPDLPMAAATPAPPESIEVHVHAAGAVTHPGLYRLRDGSRVADLIEAAGGPAADADLDQLNLARRLDDGDRVWVPRPGEAPPPGVDPMGEGSGGDGRVDINRAGASELETLPGVGPATAAAIIDWRDRHGPFRSVEQLLEVRGIGESKLAAMRDLVTV